MGIEVLKLIAVGAIVAMPPGPVLMLVLQKTLQHGRTSGFCTGLGAMFADAIYATVGLFTLGLIQGFINDNESLIMLAGGLIIVLVGCLMAFRNKPPRNARERHTSKLTKAGFGMQAFVCALSNPGAIAIMMALLAVFSLDAKTLACPIWLAIMCVALGEACYWFIFTGIVSHSLNFGEKGLRRIARFGGLILMVIGAGTAIAGLIKMI